MYNYRPCVHNSILTLEWQLLTLHLSVMSNVCFSEIQQQLQDKVETLRKQWADFMPHLAIIQVCTYTPLLCNNNNNKPTISNFVCVYVCVSHTYDTLNN